MKLLFLLIAILVGSATPLLCQQLEFSRRNAEAQFNNLPKAQADLHLPEPLPVPAEDYLGDCQEFEQLPDGHSGPEMEVQVNKDKDGKISVRLVDRLPKESSEKKPSELWAIYDGAVGALSVIPPVSFSGAVKTKVPLLPSQPLSQIVSTAGKKAAVKIILRIGGRILLMSLTGLWWVLFAWTIYDIIAIARSLPKEFWQEVAETSLNSPFIQ